MNTWLQNLFANSPFGPFQKHMNQVRDCYEQLVPLAAAFRAGDPEEIRAMAKKISQLEHAADEIKNDVRDHLPNSMFMPVNRGDLLDVLSAQDAIADDIEDVAVLMTMAQVPHEGDLDARYQKLVEAVVKVCEKTRDVVHSLDEVLEASFSKREVETVHKGIVEVCELEHETDKIQDQLVRELYRLGMDWPAPHFILWNKIVQETGSIANSAERVANRLRMITSR